MKKVLVIVVTYNGMRWLERCLGSVSQDADLYVWDNDSTDGSAGFVAASCPRAHLVRSADNLGFAQPNNAGMQYAIDHGYDYVYLLNQDAWLEPGALEKLLAAAESHPEYAVLSPLQMTDGYSGYDAQFAKCIAASHQERVAPAGARPGRVFAPRQIRKGEKAAGVYEGAEPPVLSAKRIMAAHWLVPTDAIREIGLFNQDLFPLYGQDDDWCNRARHRGWKIGIVPEARAVHDRALRAEPKERIIDRNYRIGSLVRLCDPNHPLWERFLFVCLFTTVKTVKYFSFRPIKHFFSICRQLHAVKAIRRNY